MNRRRKSKVVSLDDAVSMIKPGMTIAVGGYWYHNQPSELARALVRAGITGLRLTGAPVGGYVHDLLIGCGVVDRLLTPHVSFDELGLSPNLRRAAEAGEISIDECEEACLIGGFRAAAQDLPALPVRSLRLTEVIDQSTLVRPSDGSLSEREAIAVIPDVCIVHVACSDMFGNGCHLGAQLADRLLTRVSKRVIVTTEQVVDNERIREDPRHTTVLGLWVDAVVESPLGAHPCACPGVYGEDRGALEAYIAAGEAWRRGKPDDYQRYVSDLVEASPEAYRSALAPSDDGRWAEGANHSG